MSLNLRLKCKYQYVYGRIQTIQGKDEDSPDRLMEQFNELEQRLKAEGISPSSPWPHWVINSLFKKARNAPLTIMLDRVEKRGRGRRHSHTHSTQTEP